MVTGAAGVPGAARRPAELRRFAEASRCNYDAAALLRAADRDRLTAQLGTMSSGRDGQPRQVNLIHPGGEEAIVSFRS
jgi:hypothetical protein